jgi:predicted amidohydrolase YtcJ
MTYEDICQGEQPWVALGNFMNEWFDYANSLALQLGGITRETPDPQGGTIARFPDGTPNGVLIEGPAHAPISNHDAQRTTAQCGIVIASGDIDKFCTATR